jgi:hypothetical protein
MPGPMREIVVRRSVWEVAQDVEKRSNEIEGSFARTFADWSWNAAYARRQAAAYAANETKAQLWRAVENFFMEQETADEGTPVRIVED